MPCDSGTNFVPAGTGFAGEAEAALAAYPGMRHVFRMQKEAEPTPDWRMDGLLEALPGAKRALFARYHIGGCQSCAFDPDETLAALCERNGLDAGEVLSHLCEASAHDEALFVAPAALREMLGGPEPLQVLDIRTREEFDGVPFPGAVFFTQDVQRELFAKGAAAPAVVLVDHKGDRALDMAAWFAGHGLKSARALRGGIDAWSREVDPGVPRYRMDLDPATS